MGEANLLERRVAELEHGMRRQRRYLSAFTLALATACLAGAASQTVMNGDVSVVGKLACKEITCGALRSEGTALLAGDTVLELGVKFKGDAECEKDLMVKGDLIAPQFENKLIMALSGQHNKIDFSRFQHQVKLGTKTYPIDFPGPVAKAEVFMSGIRLFQPTGERHDFVAYPECKIEGSRVFVTVHTGGTGGHDNSFMDYTVVVRMK